MEECGLSEIITAPISGRLVQLESVPDPVFAEKMLGDGIAILPSEGILVSPVDGVIAALPRSSHACGIVSSSGLEILIHVGIDTVDMEGRGFEALAVKGESVSAGQTLIVFDMDEIAKAGKSCVSPVVISGVDVEVLATGEVSRGEPLLSVTKTDH
jgi:PTS system glucose-specific IIC component